MNSKQFKIIEDSISLNTGYANDLSLNLKKEKNDLISASVFGINSVYIFFTVIVLIISFIIWFFIYNKKRK